MKDKVIVQFVHALTNGGAETMVAKYAIELQKRGYNSKVLVMRSMPEQKNQKLLEEQGIEVIPLLKSSENIFIRIYQKIFFDALIKKRVKKFIDNNEIDVIHVHLPILRYLAAAENELDNVKIVYTCHSEIKLLYSQLKERQIDKEYLDSLLKKKKATVVVLHNRMKEETDNLFGIDSSVILENPVELSKYKDIDILKKRKDLGIPQEAFVVGHVGRFTEVKNHYKLINVFEKVLTINPCAFLVMIGDGQLMTDIKKKLYEKNITDRVLILSNRDDVAEIMQTFDVLCFPSLYEGLPLVILEAQAANLRVVMSDTITTDVVVTEKVQLMSLNDTDDLWADAVLNGTNFVKPYKKISDYNIDNVMVKLCKIYEC